MYFEVLWWNSTLEHWARRVFEEQWPTRPLSISVSGTSWERRDVNEIMHYDTEEGLANRSISIKCQVAKSARRGTKRVTLPISCWSFPPSYHPDGGIETFGGSLIRKDGTTRFNSAESLAVKIDEPFFLFASFRSRTYVILWQQIEVLEISFFLDTKTNVFQVTSGWKMLKRNCEHSSRVIPHR